MGLHADSRAKLERPVCRHYTLHLIRGCDAGRIAPLDCPTCSSYDAEQIGGTQGIEDEQRMDLWRQTESEAHDR